MGSRIKACQLDPFADRTSCATMRANQPRFWFSSLAYVLIWALRRIGLGETDFANAKCGAIRLKRLKIGALVRISVRRVRIVRASACPRQGAFARPTPRRDERLPAPTRARHRKPPHRPKPMTVPPSGGALRLDHTPIAQTSGASHQGGHDP